MASARFRPKGEGTLMAKLTGRSWALSCLVLASLLVASCGEGVRPEVEAAQRETTATQSETADVIDKVRSADSELESVRDQISEVEHDIEASRAAIAQVNRANAVLATQEALRSVPNTTVPPPTTAAPPPGPTTTATRSGSGRTYVACQHYRNVIGDWLKGILTHAELRRKVEEVYNDGTLADEPEIVQAATDLLASATAGDAFAFEGAVIQMDTACDRYGL